MATTPECTRAYLDQLDEALSRTDRDGKRFRGPRAPRRQISDIAQRRLRDLEKIAREQRKLLAEKAGDAEFARAFNETTKSMANLLEQIRRSKEAERKAFAGLSEEQLEQVLRSQLLRLGPLLDESEKRNLLTMWFGSDVAGVLLQPRGVEPSPIAEAG